MQVSKIELKTFQISGFKTLFNVLKNYTKRAYFVGGSVRDFFLFGGKSKPKDIDIEVYDIEASFTVNLSPSGDGKDHVAVFSIGLSLNTKSDGYKSIGTEGLKAKETLIKNDINTIVSGYTMEQFREDEQSVKDAILEDLQEMFGSDFIVGVSFSSVNTQ